MEKNNNKSFPQANDLEKILKIINIPDLDILLNDDLLGEYLDNISGRQARYYIAAARYLNILDHQKTFSHLGYTLREINAYMQKIQLIRIILSDKIFGTVYIAEKVLGVSLSKEDIAEIISEGYPNYSNAIYLRRAQTVRSWLNWINEQFSSN